MSININELEIINRYKQTAFRMLRLSFPSLGEKELDDAISYSILKRCKNFSLQVDNSYKNKKIDSSALEMAEYIISRGPIVTASGCLFSKHGTVPNPLYNMVEKFIVTRDNHKKEMFKYPKGSEQFQKYNLLQLLAKLDCNAIYGVLGAYSALYYNLHVATSITTQGRSSISSSIMLFESFLANNVKFGSLNEVVTFIDNVVKEPRTYNDALILDENISVQEAFYKIMTTCGFEWFPNKEEMLIVWEMMLQLSPEDLNRLYYKNNLYSFCDNKTISKAIVYILQKLDKPFLDPNHPPEEIKVELGELLSILTEYVYYKYQVIDKLDRVEMMIRDVVIITDTDSCVVSLDAWYRYTLDKVYDVPMNIKAQIVDPVPMVVAEEFNDKDSLKVVDVVEQRLDYDFYTDEMIMVEQMKNPNTVVPQDGLRHSIINIMAYCVGKLILSYMETFTKNYNSYADGKKCLLLMKNEFLFKRVLLTDGKKNYAAIQELQEGHPVPKDKSLNITGMSMDKSGLQAKTRETLKRILYEDVLNKENVDQVQLLKSIVKAEREIYDSLLNGKKEYYKPVNVKSISSYENPMRIQGIKASIVYNALRDEGTEAIDLEKRNGLDIIKVNIDRKTIECIKDKFPDKYNKILELMKINEFSTGIDTVALPLNVEVPEWIIDFVNFVAIINDNIKNFPLEAVGLFRDNNTNVNYTNILKI